MPDESYDVIVIGGGAGGVPTAMRVSQLGGRVAVIECENLGGLCMNKGCVPFDHMMVASHILGSLSLGKEMGLSFTEVSKDYGTLMKRQNELIEFMRLGVESTLKKNKVEIIKGKGRINGKGKVEVVGLIFQEQSYGIAFQADSPYREMINIALLKLVEAGIYKEIHDKWFGS